jgi:NAD(P)-dependent dehydrogenase (short-subunit alcohol dehydrogenase family)
MNPFQDRIAIVTGGASGIGKSICEHLAEHGATVVLADRNGEQAEAVASSLCSAGGRAEAVRADVADERQVRDLVERTRGRHGRIDYLFNNAGISVNGEFGDLTAEHWRSIMDVNLWGVVHGCRYAYPVMVAQGSGHIVNTASLAGLIPGGLTTCYSASKHAVVGFTLTLRAEARLYGVRVSVLCPGFIRTAIQETTPNASPFMNTQTSRQAGPQLLFPRPEDCIRQIMRGVRRNRGIIFTPHRQRIFWWLHRLFPWFMPRMFGLIISRMKKNAAPPPPREQPA